MRLTLLDLIGPQFLASLFLRSDNILDDFVILITSAQFLDGCTEEWGQSEPHIRYKGRAKLTGQNPLLPSLQYGAASNTTFNPTGNKVNFPPTIEREASVSFQKGLNRPTRDSYPLLEDI